MKKVFVVVMDFEENTDSMFTEAGIEASLENQLFDLQKNGDIESYKETVAYEVNEEQQELLISLAEKHQKS